MIDDIRTLVDRIDGERQSLRHLIAGSTERLEALDNLVAPLRAFIEQPGQESAVSPAGSPAPASTPAAGGKPVIAAGATKTPPPAIQPPGRARDGGEAKQRGGRPTRREAPLTSAPSAAASSLTCDWSDCHFQAASPHGLTVHRGRSGHRASTAPWTPTPDTAPTPPASGTASWLCGRCPGRFSTDELRQAHYAATGHGSAEPLPSRKVGGQ